MSNIYAAELLKQQDFPDNFKFYFKKTVGSNVVHRADQALEKLVRPRLKIAIVTETWPPEINGVAMSLLQLSKGLQASGHKILLIRPSQLHSCADFKPDRECLVKGQSIPKYPGLKFGWPQFMKLSAELDDFQPDVVHIVTEGPLGLAALQAARSRKLPVSSGFHSAFQDFSRFFDLAFFVKPVQRYLRWFHNATHLTCVPSKDTEEALREFGVKCPLVVVGRGVDTERFSPAHRSEKIRQQWGATEQTRVMIYVGRVSPEKEVNVLIDAYNAMKKMGKADIKLVVVGDGPDKTRLEQIHKNTDIVFTGSLGGRDLASAYASADVFVFASQVETFGNVVLEAMASGLPVVAYDYACAALHLKHEVSGWLSPIGQASALIQHMYQLPENNVLRQMGAVAREKTLQAGWNYPVQQFEQALYAVAKETQVTS